MTPRDVGRLRVLALAGIGAFAVLLLRLVQIQLLDHARLAREATTQQTQRVILEPERGLIYDRHLRPLAENVHLSRISVRPREVENTAEAAAFIRKAAGSRGERRFRAGRVEQRMYVRITQQLRPEQELALATSTLPRGIHVDPVPGRVYPLDDAGRPVVGVVGNEGAGLEGLEHVYDRDLKGRFGWATLFQNGRGLTYELPGSMVKLPETGASLVSTIDLDAQTIAVMKLREAVVKSGARSAMAIFADPRTGDILAMATVDGADPARDRRGAHRNRLIADQYEPGSTFKLLAGCAALEDGVVAPDDSFWVDKGEADLGGFTIHDSHPETGWYTFRKATAHSSNVCYARIGMRVGAERLYRYARLFGFGQPTRISLPGEAAGQIRPPSRWSARSLATISIGQEVLVTPLQLVMAYAAVANGGNLLRPRIASALVDETGQPVRQFPVETVRRVLTEETARKFRSFLREAVVAGTAAEAALPWCEVAGKTGTAQKAGEGGYRAGRYTSSFIGMAPAGDPRVVGLVILDEPRGAYYGGSVAAPVWRDIMATWAAQGRGPVRLPTTTVLPASTADASGTPVPDVRLLAPDRAEEVLVRAGYEARILGSGTRVAAQTPPAGAAAARGALVLLTLAPESGAEEVLVPDVRGLPVRDAVARLSALAIPVGRVVGSGRVVTQSPEPGRPVRPNTRCSLTLAPRGT